MSVYASAPIEKSRGRRIHMSMRIGMMIVSRAKDKVCFSIRWSTRHVIVFILGRKVRCLYSLLLCINHTENRECRIWMKTVRSHGILNDPLTYSVPQQGLHRYRCAVKVIWEARRKCSQWNLFCVFIHQTIIDMLCFLIWAGTSDSDHLNALFDAGRWEMRSHVDRFDDCWFAIRIRLESKHLVNQTRYLLHRSCPPRNQ